MSKTDENIQRALQLRDTSKQGLQGGTEFAQGSRLFYEDEQKPHLRDYLDILLRRKWIAILFLLVVVSTVVVVTFAMQPLYKATSVIQIKKEGPTILIFKDTQQARLPDDEYYETQYNILKSMNLAERVVAKLPLEQEPEHGLRKNAYAALSSIASDIFGSGSASHPTVSGKTNLSANALLKRIEVQPIKKSQLIKISFTSHDPKFAAEAANIFVQEYVQFTLENSVSPGQHASERLQKEVQLMRIRLEESERQLNDYIAKNQIVFLNKEKDYESTLTQQMGELSRELDKSKAERISKEAIYNEIKNSNSEYSALLANPLILALKQEQANLESQYFNQLKVYKPEYPKMLRIQKQLDKIKMRIEEEEQKIRNSLYSDYRIALKREKSLSSTIEALRRDILVFQQRVVPYQILKREVDANRELYNALLTRLRQVDISTTLSESAVQVIDRAEPPLKPFKPQPVRNMMLAFLVGLSGGIGLAFFVNYFDSSIQNAEEIERKSSVPVLGMVPLIKGRGRELITTGVNRSEPFAEVFKSIGACIHFTSESSSPPKQILITSPMAKDGKTTLSLNIARGLQSLKGRVIVIDSDLRNPDMDVLLKVGNATGLSSYLSGEIGYDELIKTVPHAGFDVITSGPLPENPSELLGSARMKELVERLSLEYEYVLIDSAPVLGMSDGLILSQFTESVIVVVRASTTPRDALLQTMKLLHGVNAHILGIVLNGLGNGVSRYGSYYSSYGGRRS